MDTESREQNTLEMDIITLIGKLDTPRGIYSHTDGQKIREKDHSHNMRISKKTSYSYIHAIKDTPINPKYYSKFYFIINSVRHQWLCF